MIITNSGSLLSVGEREKNAIGEGHVEGGEVNSEMFYFFKEI